MYVYIYIIENRIVEPDLAGYKSFFYLQIFSIFRERKWGEIHEKQQDLLIPPVILLTYNYCKNINLSSFYPKEVHLTPKIDLKI